MIEAVLAGIGGITVIVGLGMFVTFLRDLSDRVDQLMSESNRHITTLREDVDELKKHEKVMRMTKSEFDFFDWLACSVMLADDFETNPGFYREVICRKLVRLGMLKIEDDNYVLLDPAMFRAEEGERNAAD